MKLRGYIVAALAVVLVGLVIRHWPEASSPQVPAETGLSGSRSSGDIKADSSPRPRGQSSETTGTQGAGSEVKTVRSLGSIPDGRLDTPQAEARPAAVQP